MLVGCARAEDDGAPPSELEASTHAPTASTDAPLPLPRTMGERDWISIERRGCYEMCAQYTLTVTSTGNVEWIGKQEVHRLGPAYRRVDSAAVAQIYSAFAELDWLEIPQSGGGTDEDCSTDASTTIVSLGRGAVARTLHDYHGCDGEARTRMRALSQQLVDLLAAPGWIKRVDHPILGPDRTCRVAAFRPVFTRRGLVPWTTFTDAAISVFSHSLHQGGTTADVRVIGVDNGDAMLTTRIDALRISLQQRTYAYNNIEAHLIPPTPTGPAPGEVRVLVTAEGCPIDPASLVEAE